MFYSNFILILNPLYNLRNDAVFLMLTHYSTYIATQPATADYAILASSIFGGQSILFLSLSLQWITDSMKYSRSNGSHWSASASSLGPDGNGRPPFCSDRGKSNTQMVKSFVGGSRFRAFITLHQRENKKVSFYKDNIYS